MVDVDFVLTGANLDVVNVGGVTSAQTFDYSAGTAAESAVDQNVTAITVNAAETGSTQVSYTFATDNVGTSDLVLTIAGFDVGAVASGGDVILLSNTAGSVTSSLVATTGFTLGATVATAAIATNVILGAAAFQVTGALTTVTDAGGVEAAILAAALNSGVGNASFVYVTLDNGIDTGIYRVAFDEVAADAGASAPLNATTEITAIVLVAVLTGIADCSTLVAANIA